MSREIYVDIDRFVVFCHVTSWIGSIGAQHYYGRMIFEPNDVREELTYKLDRRAAVEHNKGLHRYGRPAHEYVKQGERTTNFLDTDQLRAAAIACFKAGKMRDRWDEKNLSFNGAIFLIEGDHGICQPQEILACAPGFESKTEQMNKLFTEGDGWYWERERNHDKNKGLDALNSQWYQVMQTVEGGLKK